MEHFRDLQEASGPVTLGTVPSVPECGPSSSQGVAPSPRAGLTPAPSPGQSTVLPAVSHSALGEFHSQLESFQSAMRMQMESFARSIASQFTSLGAHASSS